MVHLDRATHPLLIGRTLVIEHSVFFIMTGLIVEMLFMMSSCCPLFITQYNGLKISECEVHWLTDFLLINN